VTMAGNRPLCAIVIALLIGAGACGPSIPGFNLLPPLGGDDLDFSVILIGDAGGPPSADQVFRALENDLKPVKDKSVVLFLGDNIYPRGLPAPEAPDYNDRMASLDRQVKLLTNAGVKGIFVPGNHDWDRSGPDGFPAILREGAAVQKLGNGQAELLPANGCPGPDIRDVGSFRLILLDTEWMLRDAEKGRDGCLATTDSAIRIELDHALAGANGKHLVVAAHHPMRTAGEHGGYFRVNDHLFPLRKFKSWLWIPLPLIGSSYPIARASGYSPQDISHSRNRLMRETIEEAMRPYRPLVYASGHEHALQVFAGSAAQWYLVSGTGYFDHGGFVTYLDSTRYASSASGYMRLDATKTGRVRLAVMTVDRDAKSREAFSLWLSEGVANP
jgi:hypothetical protein